MLKHYSQQKMKKVDLIKLFFLSSNLSTSNEYGTH